MKHLMTKLVLLIAACVVGVTAALRLPPLNPASNEPRSEQEYHQALLNIQASLAARDEAVFTRTGRMDKQAMRYFTNLDKPYTEQDHTDQAHGPG